MCGSQIALRNHYSLVQPHLNADVIGLHFFLAMSDEFELLFSYNFSLLWKTSQKNNILISQAVRIEYWIVAPQIKNLLHYLPQLHVWLFGNLVNHKPWTSYLYGKNMCFQLWVYPSQIADWALSAPTVIWRSLPHSKSAKAVMCCIGIKPHL